MPRWYRAYRCCGSPKSIVQAIVQQIRSRDLGRYVPVLRVEKRARPGEFWLFLAIESDRTGEVPPPVTAGLFVPTSKATPFDGAFTFEDIRSMAGPETDVEDFVTRIPVPAEMDLLPEDIFGFVRDTPEDVADREARSQPYDRLLLWLSAVGASSWDAFRDACRALLPEPDAGQARRVFRRLRLLGHIEASPDGSRWSVAPTVLVQPDVVSEDSGFTLCGARDDAILGQLRQAGDVATIPLPGGDAPQQVRLDASLIEEHTDDGLPPLVGCVARRLAERLPSLDRWVERLECLSLVPTLFQLKRYDGDRFVEEPFASHTGLYELWPLETRGQSAARPSHVLFYDAPTDQWRRGDWYGLRYLDRLAHEGSCPVYYEAASCRLAVPFDWRWPELYERVLVLASGQLPRYHDRRLIYDSISSETLSLLQGKLNLQAGGDSLTNA